MFEEMVTGGIQMPCHLRSSNTLEDNVVEGTAPTSSGTNNVTTLTGAQLLDIDNLDPDCEAVLETMDSCVGCVEGVDEQHIYEEKMVAHAQKRKAAVEQHGLSEAEVAMIRLNIMEEERDDTKQVHQNIKISDIDLLNICGNDDDLDDAQANFVISTTEQAMTMSCADMVDEDLLVPRTETSNGREGVVVNKSNPLQCAICNDEALTGSVSLNRVKFANLPCCGDKCESESIKVCTSCVLVLTTPTAHGANRIGRCPRCLSWIKVHIPIQIAEKNIVMVEAAETSGICKICNQRKDHLVEDDETCDSCYLGRRQPLKYECKQCHSHQSIPHPMYRYQKAADEFGTVTWACQGKCGSFTTWKIIPEEVNRVPLGDAPQSWGTDYISQARDRVKTLRENLATDRAPLSPEAVSFVDPSQCAIL